MFELFPDPAEAERMHRISQETDYTPFLDDVRPLFDFTRSWVRSGSVSASPLPLTGASRWTGYSDISISIHGSSTGYRFSRRSPSPIPGCSSSALKQFDVSKSEALYLGDSITDREAAINAGIDYLQVGRDGEPGIRSVADLIDYS